MRSLFDTSRDDGFQEGKAKGITEGIQIGMDKGEKKKAIAIAANLKMMGLEISQIVKATGLSKDEIEKI